MRRVAAAILMAGLPGWCGTVSAQTSPVLRPYGTMQVQFNTTSVDAAEAGLAVLAPSSFETRRVRLGMDVRFGEAWIGRLEPELAMGRLQLRNAWIELAVADGWSVRAGQFKKPFGLVQLTSNTRVPTIERGVRIRGLPQAQALEDAPSPGSLLPRLRGVVLLGESQTLLDGLGYQGYDLGAAVIGRVGAVGVQAGLFNGNGPDQLDDTAAKSMAARATYRLAAGVALGAAASYRETVLDAVGTDAPARASGWAWGLDVEVGEPGRPGPALIVDLATGENFAADARFVAAQAMASWHADTRFGRFEGVEAVARVGYADPRRNGDGDDAVLITPGLNLYLMGRNRLMVNWDVFMPRGERFSTQHALRAQAQLVY